MAYLMHNVNAHVIPVPLNNLFTMHLTSLLNTPARFDSGVLKKEENAWNRSALILERSSPSLSCLDLACFRGLRCRVIFCLAAFVAETNRRPTAALAATKIFLSSICLFFPLSFLYCSSPVLSFLPRQPVFFVSFSVRSGAGPFAFGWCSRGWFRLRFFFARLFVLSRCSSVRTFRLRSLEIQLVARAPSFPPGVCFWSRLISACLKAFPSVFVFESSVWLLSGAFSLLRLLV